MHQAGGSQGEVGSSTSDNGDISLVGSDLTEAGDMSAVSSPSAAMNPGASGGVRHPWTRVAPMGPGFSALATGGATPSAAMDSGASGRVGEWTSSFTTCGEASSRDGRGKSTPRAATLAASARFEEDGQDEEDGEHEGQRGTTSQSTSDERPRGSNSKSTSSLHRGGPQWPSGVCERDGDGVCRT